MEAVQQERQQPIQLTEALRLAERGIKVIPNHYPIFDKQGNVIACSCYKGEECGSPGKHPVMPKSEKKNPFKYFSTDDPEKIAEIWTKDEHYNLAIPTGSGNDIFTLDVDGFEGKRELKEWLEEYGDLPPTPTIITGGEGLHYLWKIPKGWKIPNSAKQMSPNMDLRGEVGQSIAPGSVHKSGKRYKWMEGRSPDDVDFAHPPRWLLDKIEEIIDLQAEAKEAKIKLDDIRIDVTKRDFSRLEDPLKILCVKSKQAADILDGKKNYPDTSSRDWPLANEAALYGWDAQQITDLLLMVRSKNGEHLKHPGYYQVTVGKALKKQKEERKKAARRGDARNFVDDKLIPSITEDPDEITFESPHLKDRTHQVLEALTECQDVNLYARGDILTRAVIPEDGIPKLEALGTDGLFALAANQFRFYRWAHRKDEDGGIEKALKPMDPPERIFKNIQQSQNLWNFRKLKYTSNVPMIRRDGTVIAESGYDADSQIYFHLDKSLNIRIPDKPTKDHLKKAIGLFRDRLLTDFAFKNKQSFANALGFFLTPLLEVMSGGQQTPAFAIEANKRSSGKTELYKVFSSLSFGVDLGVGRLPAREEEVEKLLLSIVAEDKPVAVFDNVKRKIDSAALESFITSQYYNGRLLGRTQELSCPKRSIVVITANNPRYSEDMATRICRIGLDPGVSRPDKRNFLFKDVVREAANNRDHYLSALLILVKGWVLEGQPIPQDAPKTRFRTWSDTIAGILSLAEVTDFMGDNEDSLSYEEQEWEEFLKTWHEELPDWNKTGDLLKVFNPELGEGSGIEQAQKFADIIPEEIALKMNKGYNESNKSVVTRVGRILSSKKGAPYGKQNYKIVQNGQREYRVECDTSDVIRII